MTNPPASKSDIREWNATSYHRVANPHVNWGKVVLDRLPLRGDETVLDAGCGTGRLTELVLDRLPNGYVIAVDQSSNMLQQAEAHLTPRFGNRVTYHQSDLLNLTVDEPVDIIFSTATFHWVNDHPALFRRLFDTLSPGGLLIAQCGGGPNIAEIANHALAILHREPFAPSTGDWDGPWNFANAEETVDRLHGAGFTSAIAEVIHAPVVLESEAAYREFLETVVLGTHLERIPTEPLRQRFLDQMVQHGRASDPAWLLDYWRLNLQATRP